MKYVVLSFLLSISGNVTAEDWLTEDIIDYILWLPPVQGNEYIIGGPSSVSSGIGIELYGPSSVSSGLEFTQDEE